MILKLQQKNLESEKIQLKKNSIIKILLKLDSTEIENQPLEIYFEDPSLLLYSKDLKSSFNKFPITKNIDFYNPPISRLVSSLSSTPAQSTIAVATTVTFISSPTTAMTMYKVIQSLKYMALVNIELPIIVTSFSKNMDVTSRNVFSYVKEVDEDSYGCNLPIKLRESNFSCLGVNNTSIEIVVLFLLLLLKVIISVIRYFSERILVSNKISPSNPENKIQGNSYSDSKGSPSPKIITKIINKIDSLFSLALIIPLTNSLGFKLLMGNWVTLYSLGGPQSVYSLISLAFLALLLTWFILYIALVLYFGYFHTSISAKSSKLEIEKEVKVKDESLPPSKLYKTLEPIFEAVLNLKS